MSARSRGTTRGWQTSEKHVVLLGAMGVGKTTVGERLAFELDRPFLDSDRVIEERTGVTGALVAVTQGVPHLHQLEMTALSEALASEKPLVVAAAASVVDHNTAREELRDHANVWLRADPDTVSARRSGQTHRRDIADTELGGLADRETHYRDLAVAEIDTTVLTPEAAVRAIISALA